MSLGSSAAFGALVAAALLAAPTLVRADDAPAGPGLAAPPPSLEVRALIGEGAIAPSEHDGVVRLGPADADWSDLGAPVELFVTTSRGHARSGPASPGGDDATCLTQAVYYEAGFEPLAGKEAVAQVVLNRAHDARFPSNVCGVVFERTGRYGTCQFTFACDGAMRRVIAPSAWANAQAVAAQALHGFVFEPVKGATHYHADYVTPSWSATLPRIGQIGRHIFYQ